MFDKPVRLTAFIPPTPCTPEMRMEVDRLAEREGVSKAQIMRAALSLFLSANVENSDTNDKIINNQEPA